MRMDGVVREVKVRVTERGATLRSGEDREWEANRLLFVDDTVLMTDSKENLNSLVKDFGI